MSTPQEIRRGLELAVAAEEPLAAADALCRACVDLLDVDDAVVALVLRGQPRGTFGSSGALGRWLEEVQFTYGEGPGLEAVTSAAPVVVTDLTAAGARWPTFAAAAADAGVRGVVALPVVVVSSAVGALCLFRRATGPLAPDALEGALLAAQLASLPVADGLARASRRSAAGVEDGPGPLQRAEVHQATGVLLVQAGLDPAGALVRLRARAFATGTTASEVAWEVLGGGLRLDAAGTWHRGPGGTLRDTAPGDTAPGDTAHDAS